MSSFFAWLPESGWSRVMCDALWQSTLIAGFGYLAARLLTRQSAARAWLLLLTLTACLLVPLASLAARESGWTVTWPRLSETQASLRETRPRDIAERETVLAVQLEAAPATPSGTPPEQAASGRDATAVAFNVLGIVWLTASALLALRLALSCLATVRLIRRAAPCADVKLISASASAAKRVGLSAPPTLLVSRSVRTPTIFALGTPRLLIPSDDLLRQEDKKIDWTAAFTHELAHAARRDGWARLWVEIVLIALPLQPLVWLSRRAFHGACEDACDDWAVATGSNPVDFAEMLTTWIGTSKPKPALLAIGMSSTKARTLRLLSLRRKPTARLGGAWRWAGAVALPILVASLAVAQAPTEKKEPAPAPASVSKTEPKSATEKPASSSGKEAKTPSYVIQPGDTITIGNVQLVPKNSRLIGWGDVLEINVVGALKGESLNGKYSVRDGGWIQLTPRYGSVKVGGLTLDEATDAVAKKLAVDIRNPQVALSLAEIGARDSDWGSFSVEKNGEINAPFGGRTKAAGLTAAELRAELEKLLSEQFVEPKLRIDVDKLSSNAYYVIVEGKPRRLTASGHETVMDTISECDFGGHPIKSITIERPASATRDRATLNVHWQDVLHGDDTTNYQILPGDRIFVDFEQPTGEDSFIGGAAGYGQGKSANPASSSSKH